MTQEEKAKAYDEALEDMRAIYPNLKGDAKLAVEHAFPELSESEDERIRKLLVWQVYRNIEDETNDLAGSVYDGIKGHDPDLEESIEDWKKCLAYLEKQKEQKPVQSEEEKEYVKTLKGLVSDFIRDSGGGITDIEYYQNICDWLDGRHIEQKPAVTHGETYHVDTLGTQQVIAGKMPEKPASTEDMPYITDEHFYEREPADSFKYKLAEYMTRSCTKKEGPYGYEYGISAETILKMAEEELLKRGVVQKPAEWSEEDEEMLNSCISSIEESKENRYAYKENDGDTSYDREIAWLKSLRPSWKPSEEQMKAHLNGVMTGDRIARESSPMPEDTVIFQKGVAEGRRLERDDGGLAWQDIKSIVQIADKMLDDPKARVAFQNHNEEYYYKKVLEQYNNSRDEANSED